MASIEKFLWWLKWICFKLPTVAIIGMVLYFYEYPMIFLWLSFVPICIGIFIHDSNPPEDHHIIDIEPPPAYDGSTNASKIAPAYDEIYMGTCESSVLNLSS